MRKKNWRELGVSEVEAERGSLGRSAGEPHLEKERENEANRVEDNARPLSEGSLVDERRADRIREDLRRRRRIGGPGRQQRGHDLALENELCRLHHLVEGREDDPGPRSRVADLEAAVLQRLRRVVARRCVRRRDGGLEATRSTFRRHDAAPVLALEDTAQDVIGRSRVCGQDVERRERALPIDGVDGTQERRACVDLPSVSVQAGNDWLMPECGTRPVGRCLGA